MLFLAGQTDPSSAARAQSLQQATQGASPVQLQVDIQHDAGTTRLEVDEDQTILEAALDSGLELSHDCKMGVCMTCPAKLVRPVGLLQSIFVLLTDRLDCRSPACCSHNAICSLTHRYQRC